MSEDGSPHSNYRMPGRAGFITPSMLRDFNWMLRLLRGARGQNGISVRTNSGVLEVAGGRGGGGSYTGSFRVTKDPDDATQADISDGYGCYAGTFSDSSTWTPNPVTGFTAVGVHYVCAKIDFSTAAWAFQRVFSSLPANTDSIQYYILAKVTVAYNDEAAQNQISEIEQWWRGGTVIYENRV